MILAIGIKMFVRRIKLDRKVKLFRFRNYWYYVFSGEILDFPYIKGKASNISFAYIDIMVNVNNQTIIYTGLYYDHVMGNPPSTKISMNIFANHRVN
jgi:hypothetical protein